MRNVVITGGTRGIGAAAAMRFAENGDRVFAIFEKDEASAEKMSQIPGIITLKADISDENEVAEVVKRIHSVCRYVDVLINNAGIAQIKMFNDITIDDWDRMFNVNVRGAFLMTKALLPDFIAVKRGKIVNVSSIWGQCGGSCEVHYSASKSALIGFTKALAKELGPSKICVNCVAPGVIDTDMNNELEDEDIETLKSEIPLGRIGNTKDAAECIFFLADDKSGYITGQVIPVNGGMYI